MLVTPATPVVPFGVTFHLNTKVEFVAYPLSSPGEKMSSTGLVPAPVNLKLTLNSAFVAFGKSNRIATAFVVFATIAFVVFHGLA